MKDEIAKTHRVSGATIHISPEKPIPAALVKKILRARFAENQATGGKKVLRGTSWSADALSDETGRQLSFGEVTGAGRSQTLTAPDYPELFSQEALEILDADRTYNKGRAPATIRSKATWKMWGCSQGPFGLARRPAELPAGQPPHGRRRLRRLRRWGLQHRVPGPAEIETRYAPA